MPITNIGSGEIKEVRDSKLPQKIDPECLRSQEQGWFGDRGLNKQTMNESLADFNHGVDISGEKPDPKNGYSGSR
jgi:hypothetical protein